MTGSDPAADADASDDRSASTASETTAATEPMSDSTPDADERDSSTTDAAPDPDALFEDEGARGPAESDPDARGPVGSDSDAAADGMVSIDDGPIAKLYWAGLAAAVAFGAFALYRFYASVTTAIDVWVAADYQPLLQAAFNFAVLLSTAVAASLLVRRLSAGRA